MSQNLDCVEIIDANGTVDEVSAAMQPFSGPNEC
jgi:hypothetical protein